MTKLRNVISLFDGMSCGQIALNRAGILYSKYYASEIDKHGVLTSHFIRKLTPLECEMLQNVPENYTCIVSDTQRYRMLGNGWTVDVIAHIFKGIKEA